jgi:hypothetical protein
MLLSVPDSVAIVVDGAAVVGAAVVASAASSPLLEPQAATAVNARTSAAALIKCLNESVMTDSYVGLNSCLAQEARIWQILALFLTVNQVCAQWSGSSGSGSVYGDLA